MTTRLVFLAVLATLGCGGVDLSTPRGAARCQAAAIRKQDFARWSECMHPKVRKEFEASVRDRQIDWKIWSADADRLEAAQDSDFDVEEPEPGDVTYGDRYAHLPLTEDRFSIARLDGKWYVVETGL